MTFAMRRAYITVSPCWLLTHDDRPRVRERKPDHVWGDEEMTSLVEAAKDLAARPEARYDYSRCFAWHSRGAICGVTDCKHREKRTHMGCGGRSGNEARCDDG